MKFIPIKTRELNPPKEDLYKVLDQYVPPLKEKDVLVITSKIVSIHQGRCFKKETVDKEKLVIAEAQSYFHDNDKKGRTITVVNHALAINSGVDPFNGYYVLLPKNPNQEAKKFAQYLKKRFKISDLGIIITDSHSLPLRRGVICYAVGYYGISPLTTTRDIKTYKGWTSNVVDTLASFAGLYLGESAQKHARTPMVIARDIDFVEFSDKSFDEDFFVEGKNDMYGALYKHFEKKK